MRRINQAWLDGHVEDLAPMVHPEMVMVFPGFAGRMQGRDAFLAGFRDFCQNAKVHYFRDHDHQVDVTGSVAAVTFRYEMIYERSRERFRSTGRDLWVFQSHNKEWVAVWRTMLDVVENPA
jgi:prepilin-type processing-associated H-X9-DG protein